MLTVIFLMRALDPVKYKDETYALLSRVMECDSMRKEYYRDLRKLPKTVAAYMFMWFVAGNSESMFSNIGRQTTKFFGRRSNLVQLLV